MAEDTRASKQEEREESLESFVRNSGKEKPH